MKLSGAASSIMLAYRPCHKIYIIQGAWTPTIILILEKKTESKICFKLSKFDSKLISFVPFRDDGKKVKAECEYIKRVLNKDFHQHSVPKYEQKFSRKWLRLLKFPSERDTDVFYKLAR